MNQEEAQVKEDKEFSASLAHLLEMADLLGRDAVVEALVEVRRLAVLKVVKNSPRPSLAAVARIGRTDRLLRALR